MYTMNDESFNKIEELTSQKLDADYLLNISSGIILRLDKSSKIKLLNNRGHKILGYELGELNNKDWFRTCIPKKNRSQTKEVFTHLMHDQGANAELYENDVQCKDGSIKTILWRNAAIRDSSKKIIGTISSGEDISEIKQANRVIQESELKYRTLTENTTDIISLHRFNLNLTLSYVSPSVKAFTGYVQEEVVGKSLFGFVHPEDKKELLPVLKEYISYKTKKLLFNKEIPLNKTFEFRLKHKLGHWINVQSTVNILEKQIVVVTRDITDRKQAEEKIRSLSEMVKQSAEGIAQADLKGNITYVNKAWSDMHGYNSPDECLGKHLSIFHSKVQLKNEVIPFNEKVKKYGTYNGEVGHITKDGKIFPTLMTSTVLKNEQGNPIALIGAAQDITEQKLTIIQLMESEERFRSLYENANIGIYRTTPAGEIILANPALTNMLGYSTFDELKNRNLNKTGYLPSYKRKTFIDKIEKDGIVKGLETAWTTKDGSTIYIRESSRAVRDTNGQTLYYDGTVEDVTERKFAEESLSQSEKQLRMITDNTTDNISITTFDLKATYIYVNPSIKHVLGYDPKDLVGKSFFDYVHPDDKKILLPLVKKYIRKKIKGLLSDKNVPISETIEYRFKNKIGDWRYLQSTVNLIGTQLLAVSRDITEQKLVEHELRSSEEKLKILFESAPDAYYLMDLKGNYVDANIAALKMLGYKKEELSGKNLLNQNFLSGKEILKASKLLVKNVQGKGTGPDEFILYRKDRSQVPVEILTYPVKINNKKIILGIARDVSKRKLAEEQINTTSQRLQLATKSANIGIWNLNLNKNILWWDERQYEIYGINPKDFGGAYEAWQKCVHPDDIIRSNAEVQEAIAGMKDFHSQFRIIWPNGQVRFIQAHAKIQLTSDGSAQNMIGVNWDITEQKQAELELIKHRDHLEELVQMRTLELSEVNKELEAFAYSISHDLRAPLRAVDGFTSILIEDYASKLDKEGKRIGSVVQDNAKKMGKLIDDLLSFSRLGRSSIVYSDIDMRTMVNTIYHEVTSVDERKRIKFTIGDIPTINGDTSMIRQVWINLISNAVKFSFKRKQSIITVSSKEEKDKIIYSLKDNGVGFDMKYIDKLFGVFQRLHSEKEFEGTGVGLALVQRILRRHNGTIWAESEVDKGAKFYFSLPKKLEGII